MQKYPKKIIIFEEIIKQNNMYYEINVSLNGSHFFATAERSITSLSKAQEVVKIFLRKFHKSQGYEITITTNYKHSVIEDINDYINTKSK